MTGTERKANSIKSYRIDEKLNASIRVGIATACENQCVRTNVNSQKLGRTRS